MFSRLFKKAPFKNMHGYIIYVRREKLVWLNHVDSVAIVLQQNCNKINVSSYLNICPNCLSNTNVFYNVSKMLKQHHLLCLMHVMCNHDILISGE